jgi:hypothetical protein
MSLYHCLAHAKVSVEACGTCIHFVTRPVFTMRICLLDNHPNSAVCDCLFNIFAATLHSGGRSSILILRTLHTVLTETHLSWVKLQHCINQEFNIKTPTCFNQRTLFQTHITTKEKKSSLTYNHLITETY